MWHISISFHVCFCFGVYFRLLDFHIRLPDVELLLHGGTLFLFLPIPFPALITDVTEEAQVSAAL